MDGELYLKERVANLDRMPADPRVNNFHEYRGLAQFITVLERADFESPSGSGGLAPIISPAEADDLIGRCRLLTQLRHEHPQIASGPARTDFQYWTGTPAPLFLPPGRVGNEVQLRESEFVKPRTGRSPCTTKPSGMGLYTSGGQETFRGMWRLYLDLNAGSTLFPYPWWTWHLQIRAHARIAEIASALAWTTFVERYPLREGGLVYPDWEAISADWDAVHMALDAVAAIQGLRFAVGLGTIAPAHWGIESTFWLRWCFEGANLLEIVKAK
jgi:hypothetical protein